MKKTIAIVLIVLLCAAAVGAIGITNNDYKNPRPPRVIKI